MATMRAQAVCMPTRALLATSLTLTACAAGATGAHEPAPLRPPAPAAASDLPVRTGDVHDFDFLAGAWTVTNRRLKARGVGSTDWEEFPAAICATIYLGGVANVDEILFPTKGWSGVTLRTFH